MTAKKSPFAKTLQTSIVDGSIFTVGDCCVCLRLGPTETYSNLKEFADDGSLVPQFTDMLDEALSFAQHEKPAILNVTLVAHAFVRQLLADIGEADFKEVLRKQREKPIAGVCYSHDYCDANETMAEAMASFGLDLMGAHDGENGGPEYDRLVNLWNAAWDHAKLRMAAMPI